MTEHDHGWPEFWDLWSAGAWEAGTHAVIKELLGPGDLFLDVGAWIGPVTLWALAQGADVIAVEPDPVARAELRDVVAPFGSRVEIIAGAMTVHGGEVLLAHNPKLEGAFGDSMSRIGEGDGAVLVNSWRLVDILDTRIPKLMKMDVEGYELVLAPWIMPWLCLNKVAVHISCHGQLLEPELFAGYREVRWPDNNWGDIVAIP